MSFCFGSTGSGIGPSLGGFQGFVTDIMQVPNPPFDPANPSPVVTYSYDFALDWVTNQLCLVPSQPGTYTMYARAIYNLAADTLINWAQDGPNDPVFKDGLQYWAWLRQQYGVFNFVAGVVQSTSDEGTSASYMVPDTFKNYTIANLQQLKTPYGRFYLGIASSLGTLWGLS